MGAEAARETCFKARWNRFAAARGLGDDPQGVVPSTTVEQLRRDALEFFSWGSVDGVRYQWRVEHLFPDAAAELLDKSNVAPKLGPSPPAAPLPSLPGQLPLFY